jgi:tungstate transport system permease protein
MEYIVEGFKIAWSLLLSGNSDLYNIIFITIQVSSASILVSIIIGLPAGFALGYFNFPAKRFIKAVVDTVLALPTVVVGLLVYAFLTRNGPSVTLVCCLQKVVLFIGQVILILPIVKSLTSTALKA